MKKGQAAMEFLITYGWAILAAILVIGALAYVAFKPSTIVPNMCVVSTPFTCELGTASKTGIELALRNGGGDTFNVVSVDVAGCGTKTDIGEVADGALKEFGIACNLTTGKF